MANFNFNKIILGGRLTADVELKQSPSGVPVCTFTIAVARKSNKKETDFINCIAWRSTAEFITRYFSKGQAICVVGSLQVRTWTDNQGNKRVSTEVVADEANFVESKGGEANNAEPTTEVEPLINDDDLPF